MRLIHIARRKAVDALFNESFSNSWKYVFLPRVRNILGERPRVDDLIELGEKLSDIFTAVLMSAIKQIRLKQLAVLIGKVCVFGI